MVSKNDFYFHKKYFLNSIQPSKHVFLVSELLASVWGMIIMNI